MKTLAPLLVLPFLIACSSGYMRAAEPGAAPGDQEARVVFCRSNSAAGSAMTFAVWDRTTLIGFGEKGRYFEYRCAPGRHLFLAEGEGTSAIDAELGPRATYYVWLTAQVGVFSANVGFTPVTQDSDLVPKIRKVLVKSKCRELIPELAAEYGNERRESIQKLVEEFEGPRNKEALKIHPQDNDPQEALRVPKHD